MNTEEETSLERHEEAKNKPQTVSNRNRNLPLEASDQTPLTPKPQYFSSCSHKPGFFEACSLTLLLTIIAGILQGYPESLEVIIMAKGASYSDQALLSLNNYPFMFKIFLAPFLDIYYLKRLGKCKTLVTISGIALFLLLFFFGVNSEKYIESNSIWVITFLWFLISIFVVLMHLGANVWALTLLEGKMRYMGGIMSLVGVNTGRAIGYNLFVLLNSKDWWNEHIFQNSSYELQGEIVTHKGFIRGVSVLVLGTTVYCLVFAGEKVVENSRTKTLAQTFRMTRKMLQISQIIKMIAIFFFYQLFVFMFNKSIEFKFVELGVNKASLVNIQSGVLPLKLLLLALAPFFSIKSLLMRQVLGFQLGAVSGALILLTLAWNLSNGSGGNSLWMMIGFFLRDLCFVSRQLLYSKVTEVIPEDIGATGLTIFAALSNISKMIPSSIGLKLADLVSEKTFFRLVLGTILLQFVVICFLWPLAVDVDKAKIEEFRIEGAELQEGGGSSDSETNLLEPDERE